MRPGKGEGTGAGAAIPANLAGFVAREMGIALEAPRHLVRRYPSDATRAIPFLQPWIPGFLTSYQKEGIAWVLGQADHCGSFWWSAGSGKTLAAIVWLLSVGIGLSIVCTKAAIRPTWKREVGTYSREVSLFTAQGTTPDAGAVRAWIRAALTEGHPAILVVAYETLPAWIGLLEGLGATSLVFDEIHSVKSHRRWDPIVGRDDRVSFAMKENRAAACMRLSQRIPRRLALTATPIRDRVRDLWAQLDLIHPREWGSFARFADRYCARVEGPYGWDTRGASHLDELKARTATVTHRVPYTVANRELPPKRRLVTWISIPDQDRPLGNVASEIRAARRAGPTALLEARLMEAASRKRKTVLAHARDALEASLKVVIFTGRRIDCEKLAADARAWLNPGPSALACHIWSAHGGDSAELREEIRAAYMASPAPAILIGTGEAWGECIAPDTMILGVNRRLSECRAGDSVIGESGIGQCADVKTHDYTGTMIEIRAQGLLPLHVTAGHAVATMPGGITPGRDRHFVFRTGKTWKNAEKVTPWDPHPESPTQATGDFLLIPRLAGHFHSVTFDLAHYAANEHGQATREGKGAPRKLDLDADLAWAMGLYAAQGCATDQTRGGCRATWSIDAKKRALADRVASILRPRGFGVHIRQQRTWLHVTAKSGSLSRLLRDLMGKGAVNKRIPHEILLHSDLAILRAFLDGYAAGDGYTAENGRKVQAATISRILTLQLQLALARFGRLAGICLQKGRVSQIEGRTIQGRDYYLVTWRWHNERHERFKVLDKYIATPVKAITAMPYSGLVGSMTTGDMTLLASNVITHNGLDLQDTDLGIFAMLPYTPGQVIQWEGRWCRLGQKRPVLIRYFIAENTADEHVAQLLLHKLPAVERAAEADEIAGLGETLIGASEEELLSSLTAKIMGVPA